jgi:hypothetical protein
MLRGDCYRVNGREFATLTEALRHLEESGVG